ncbi:MAG: hypothetical protein M0008_03230 [Actinomycetota bacterium]|nr:hypothetical protein [Actinomycetota bacterium]
MIPEAKRDQIADFVRRRITFVPKPPQHYWVAPYQQCQTLPLPTKEQFAQALLADAEFRSLQLGTWLGTTNGEIITAAVSMVIAPVYAPEFELAVEGLKLAATLQHQEGQGVAGQTALVIVGVSLMVVGIGMIARDAA